MNTLRKINKIYLKYKLDTIVIKYKNNIPILRKEHFSFSLKVSTFKLLSFFLKIGMFFVYNIFLFLFYIRQFVNNSFKLSLI